MSTTLMRSSIKELPKELQEIIERSLELAQAHFPQVYGRYHNHSQTLYFDVFEREGKIIWREGPLNQVGQAAWLPEEELEFKEAFPRFRKKLNNGFTSFCHAPTATEIEALVQDKSSSLRVDGKLGTYRKGKNWVRVKEYEDLLFHVEKGYDTSLLDFFPCEAEEALKLILEIEKDGFKK